MERRNFILTFILAAAMLLAAGYLRPPDYSTDTVMFPPAFKYYKLTSVRCFDIVVAGDSRTQADIWPAAMLEALPDARIFNFGFPGVGYDREYLDAVESKLDPAYPHPVIVLAITPMSLTPKALRANTYLSARDEDRVAGWASYHLPGFFRFFDRISARSIFYLLSRKQFKPRIFGEAHPDGWANETIVPPLDDFSGQYKTYERWFAESRVSPDQEKEVLDAVREWSGRGIMVIGLRLPASPRIFEIERDESGFDATGFPERFTKAGGKWIVFEGTSYTTNDGSHLNRDSAIRISRELANKIKDLRADSTRPANP